MRKCLEEPCCRVILMSPGHLTGVAIEQASHRELELSGDLLQVPVECEMHVRGIQASSPPVHTSLCRDPFYLFLLMNSRWYMWWKKMTYFVFLLSGMTKTSSTRLVLRLFSSAGWEDVD